MRLFISELAILYFLLPLIAYSQDVPKVGNRSLPTHVEIKGGVTVSGGTGFTFSGGFAIAETNLIHATIGGGLRYKVNSFPEPQISNCDWCTGKPHDDNLLHLTLPLHLRVGDFSRRTSTGFISAGASYNLLISGSHKGSDFRNFYKPSEFIAEFGAGLIFAPIFTQVTYFIPLDDPYYRPNSVDDIYSQRMISFEVGYLIF